MKAGILEQAVKLACGVGYVLIATVGENKWPHLAVACKIELKQEDRIAVSEWYCTGTMVNLKMNNRVTLVVWDEITDIGYQLFGEMERVADVGMLDRYSPKMKIDTLLPQVESQIIVRIGRITDFRRAPHTDVERIVSEAT